MTERPTPGSSVWARAPRFREEQLPWVSGFRTLQETVSMWQWLSELLSRGVPVPDTARIQGWGLRW